MMKINNLPNENSISTIRGWPFKLVVFCCALLLLALFVSAMLAGKFGIGFSWLGFLLIFLILAPIAWTLGDRFRKFTLPDSYFASDGMDAFGKKMYWLVGPQQASVYFLLFVVYFSGNFIASRISAAAPVVAELSEKKFPVNGSPSDLGGASSSKLSGINEKIETTTAQSPAIEPLKIPAPAPAPAISSDESVKTSSLQPVWAPSFNCMKASNFSEKSICSDSLLGKLDGVLSQNYKFLLASDVGEITRYDLKVTQKNWLVDRNQCTNNQCLIDSYKKRIEEICDHSVISGARPICVRSSEI